MNLTEQKSYIAQGGQDAKLKIHENTNAGSNFTHEIANTNGVLVFLFKFRSSAVPLRGTPNCFKKENPGIG